MNQLLFLASMPCSVPLSMMQNHSHFPRNFYSRLLFDNQLFPQTGTFLHSSCEISWWNSAELLIPWTKTLKQRWEMKLNEVISPWRSRGASLRISYISLCHRLVFLASHCCLPAWVYTVQSAFLSHEYYLEQYFPKYEICTKDDSRCFTILLTWNFTVTYIYM